MSCKKVDVVGALPLLGTFPYTVHTFRVTKSMYRVRKSPQVAGSDLGTFPYTVHTFRVTKSMYREKVEVVVATTSTFPYTVHTFRVP